MPSSWSDTDAHFVVPKHPTANGDGVEHIRLRSFGTGVHKVDGSVAVRLQSAGATDPAVPRRRLCVILQLLYTRHDPARPSCHTIKPCVRRRPRDARRRPKWSIRRRQSS